MATSNPAGGHLSGRRYVYTVPLLGKAEWVVIDLDDPWVTSVASPILTRHPKVVRRFARQLESDSTWTKVFERNRVLVFRKAA